MIRFFACLLCLLVTSPALAQEIANWSLKGLSGVSGTFVSETQGRDSSDASRSAGRFASVKPNHYLWDVQTPDKQVLLINPAGFWQIDHDLEVVIVRDIPSTSQLPLANLWMDDTELAAFRQKVADGELEAISAFDLKVLSPTTIEMRLVDALERETRFTLNIESTEAPDEAEFLPIIPVGAEFFDERNDISVTEMGKQP